MIRMIATGHWTAFDLVKYLVSVRSSLTVTLGGLGEAHAFSKEGAGKEQPGGGTSPKVQRYRAKELYEPIDIFRELGLPIIDWGANNQWRPESDEGKFLWCFAVECPSNQSTAKFVFSLGLRRAPPLTEILHIAASDNSSVRKKALSFFLDNISNKYTGYNPKNFQDLAFVPAILGSEKVLAKPFEVRGLTPSCFPSSKPIHGSCTLALNGQQ
jgi:hypothetical protein